VKAKIGKDFLFHESIPRSENEPWHGYLRVSRSSLWFQQREFPPVYGRQRDSRHALEKGYTWSINSSTWNHLKALWQGSHLDLLDNVYEETQHQDCI
jgi:hypothetical protein